MSEIWPDQRALQLIDQNEKLQAELSAANKRIEDLRDVLDEILLHMNKTDLGYFFPDGEQGALDRAKELL